MPQGSVPCAESPFPALAPGTLSTPRVASCPPKAPLYPVSGEVVHVGARCELALKSFIVGGATGDRGGEHGVFVPVVALRLTVEAVGALSATQPYISWDQ